MSCIFKWLLELKPYGFGVYHMWNKKIGNLLFLKVSIKVEENRELCWLEWVIIHSSISGLQFEGMMVVECVFILGRYLWEKVQYVQKARKSQNSTFFSLSPEWANELPFTDFFFIFFPLFVDDVTKFCKFPLR